MDKSVESSQYNFSDLTDSEALLCLFLFVLQQEHEFEEEWNEFANEIVYHDRFISSHKVIDAIKDSKDWAVKKIPKGQVFYRARKFHDDKSDRVVEYILRASGKTEEELQSFMDTVPDYLRELFVMPDLLLAVESLAEDEDDGRLSHRAENLSKAWDKWRKNIRYKGYNRKDSSAPPNSRINEGRCNPAYIRYLYLAEDKKTTVYEIKPQIGDIVSVARVRTKRELKLYDLTGNHDNTCATITSEQYGLFNTIVKMFSKPGSGQQHYLPTQRIAEEIKAMGFDGIRYNSSLHSEGVNVVLFEPEDCEIGDSHLVQVTNIHFDFVDPYDFSPKS